MSSDATSNHQVPATSVYGQRVVTLPIDVRVKEKRDRHFTNEDKKYILPTPPTHRHRLVWTVSNLSTLEYSIARLLVCLNSNTNCPENQDYSRAFLDASSVESIKFLAADEQSSTEFKQFEYRVIPALLDQVFVGDDNLVQKTISESPNLVTRGSVAWLLESLHLNTIIYSHHPLLAAIFGKHHLLNQTMRSGNATKPQFGGTLSAIDARIKKREDAVAKSGITQLDLFDCLQTLTNLCKTLCLLSAMINQLVLKVVASDEWLHSLVTSVASLQGIRKKLIEQVLKPVVAGFCNCLSQQKTVLTSSKKIFLFELFDVINACEDVSSKSRMSEYASAITTIGYNNLALLPPAVAYKKARFFAEVEESTNQFFVSLLSILNGVTSCRDDGDFSFAIDAFINSICIRRNIALFHSSKDKLSNNTVAFDRMTKQLPAGFLAAEPCNIFLTVAFDAYSRTMSLNNSLLFCEYRSSRTKQKELCTEGAVPMLLKAANFTLECTIGEGADEPIAASFKVHDWLLMARWPLFLLQLQAGFEECHQRKIVLRNTSGSMLAVIVAALYAPEPKPMSFYSTSQQIEIATYLRENGYLYRFVEDGSIDAEKNGYLFDDIHRLIKTDDYSCIDTCLFPPEFVAQPSDESATLSTQPHTSLFRPTIAPEFVDRIRADWLQVFGNRAGAGAAGGPLFGNPPPAAGGGGGGGGLGNIAAIAGIAFGGAPVP